MACPVPSHIMSISVLKSSSPIQITCFFISGKPRFCPFKIAHQPRSSLYQVHPNRSTHPKTLSAQIRNREVQSPQQEGEIERANKEGNSFWAAVSLIIGTAVGPGMLGLPAATMKSGILPSTIAIIFSWVYVISSVLLVAELSFVTMEEDGLDEVSFTRLATKAFGTHFGSLVSLVLASLSLSLLIACVAGIGSIFAKCFPLLNALMANALFPLVVVSLLWFFPFEAIDVVNRGLCFMMLLSITALVGVGLLSMSMAGGGLLGSLAYASWNVSSLLPAIPVAVLTLGFHVITPFICSLARISLSEVRRGIIAGGAVPLIMVLSWNVIVHGIAASGGSSSSYTGDPISLLLSVRSSALLAIQGFAFSALATSLIGYAVSFPKQLIDTLMLFVPNKDDQRPRITSPMSSNNNGVGKVGIGTYYSGAAGNAGTVYFHGYPGSHQPSSGSQFIEFRNLVLPVVLSISVVVASYYQSTFSRALDFAGVYANCFLFGILPPIMVFIYKSKRKIRSSILPGGDGALLILFGIAVILGIWH